MDELALLHQTETGWRVKWRSVQFYVKLLFRLSEIVGRMFCLTIVWLIFGTQTHIHTKKMQLIKKNI